MRMKKKMMGMTMKKTETGMVTKKGRWHGAFSLAVATRTTRRRGRMRQTLLRAQSPQVRPAWPLSCVRASVYVRLPLRGRCMMPSLVGAETVQDEGPADTQDGAQAEAESGPTVVRHRTRQCVV